MIVAGEQDAPVLAVTDGIPILVSAGTDRQFHHNISPGPVFDPGAATLIELSFEDPRDPLMYGVGVFGQDHRN